MGAHDGPSGNSEEQEHPLRADLRKYYRVCLGTETPTARQKVRLWLTHQGLHCVAAYRFACGARRFARRRPRLGAVAAVAAGALDHTIELLHHVRIYADVGPGFFIGHASTIYVGPTTIGGNFSITHNVTVGYGHTAGFEGTPVIGDDVWIGTGSVISGAIRVGDRVTIANGTMLSRSVGPGSLVAGNPGRVVSHGFDNGPLLGESGTRRGAPDGQAMGSGRGCELDGALRLG